MNLQEKKRSPGTVSSAMNDHTTRSMYTKRVPGDINIYAMNEDLTTQKLSKKEKQRLANRQSYQRNREKRIKACMETYMKKREQLLPLRRDYNKNYYNNNKEQILIDVKEYYLNNREEKKTKSRLYYKHNRERILQYNRSWTKQRLKIDQKYKLECRLRNRMYHVFKHLGLRKSESTLQLLGCSVEEARLHIEKLWQPGMSWENYNLHTWHIDHIRPINTFDLTDVNQQKQCFHYTNLRPLWAKENWSRPKNGSDVID